MQCYSICQSKNYYYYCYNFSPKHSALFVMIPQTMWLLEERCAGQLNSQNWVTSIRAESSREQNMHCNCIAMACQVHLQKMKKIQSVFIVQTLERLWCSFFQHVLKHSEKYQWWHKICSDTTDLKILWNSRSAFPQSHQHPAAVMSVSLWPCCAVYTRSVKYLPVLEVIDVEFSVLYFLYYFWQYTQPIKSLGSVKFSFKEINTFIQQGCIKLIKSDSKYIKIEDRYFKL